MGWDGVRWCDWDMDVDTEFGSAFCFDSGVEVRGHEGSSARDVFLDFCDAGGGFVLARLYDGDYNSRILMWECLVFQ